MRSLFLIICFGASFWTLSQDRGSVLLEVGGVGGFGSLSYSKQFKSWEKLALEYRAGISFVPIDKNNGNGIIFPLLVHATYGSGKHFADVGIGQSITVTTRGSAFVRMPASFGYRLQTNGRMFYRVAYTPLISYIYNFQWEHWGGVTIGFNL
ncbi:MAG: hypothetical protein ACFHU9_00960 [Fluviicola sp.]